MIDEFEMKGQSERFDPRLFALIPHRPPMLLINRIVNVSEKQSSAIVLIDEKTPFFDTKYGVPSWIGIEYMGQTAALIAGYQLEQGLVKPYLGFLIGARSYQVKQAYFSSGQSLQVHCQEEAVVGNELASFNCKIYYDDIDDWLAQASLSVLRQPLPK
ncbi:3-hydroxydecanoyl-ACP dehydratase [Gammaproteobacteria bacterium AH-315-M22]|nr:3-hydroxydecanoyl-ACP dehydratase [Gammaproteobacteria bacterium AH-315-M22]